LDSLGTAQGGIRYNSSTGYIQVLSSNNSTWVDWKLINADKVTVTQATLTMAMNTAQWNSSGYTLASTTLFAIMTHGDVTFIYNASTPREMRVTGPKNQAGYTYDPTTITAATLTQYVTNSVSAGTSRSGIVVRNRIVYGAYNYTSSTFDVSLFEFKFK
jgi:hypothetical protein